jgi:hypothetical protein
MEIKAGPQVEPLAGPVQHLLALHPGGDRLVHVISRADFLQLLREPDRAYSGVCSRPGTKTLSKLRRNAVSASISEMASASWLPPW